MTSAEGDTIMGGLKRSNGGVEGIRVSGGQPAKVPLKMKIFKLLYAKRKQHSPHCENWRVKPQAYKPDRPHPPQNMYDMNESEEQPLAKVGWICLPHFCHVATPLTKMHGVQLCGMDGAPK